MKKRFGFVLVAVLVLALSGVTALAAPPLQEATPTQQPAAQETPAAAGAATGDTSAAQNQAAGMSTLSLRGSRVFGYRLVDQQGNLLGQVENLIVQVDMGDAQGEANQNMNVGTANVRYLVVSPNTGGGRVAVPAMSAQIDPQAGVFMVNLTADDLQTVPSLGEASTAENAAWDAEIGAYWQERGVNLPELDQNDQPVTARQLMGFSVSGANDQDLGNVEDLIVQFAGNTRMASAMPMEQGAETGTTNQGNQGNQFFNALPIQSAVVRYVVVSTNASGDTTGRRAAVPLTATSANFDTETLVLDTRAALQDVPALTGRIQGSNPNWDRDIEGYWVTLGFLIPGVSGQNAAGATGTSDLLYRASRIIGFPVLGSDNNEIGEVEDVILPLGGQGQMSQEAQGAREQQASPSGKSYALIGVGGFLGLGEEYVAIPLSQMRLHLVRGIGDAAGVGNAAYPYGSGYYGYNSTGLGAYPRGIDGRPFYADQPVVTQNAFLTNLTQADFDAAPRLNLDNIDLTDPNWDADLRPFWENRGVEYGEEGTDVTALRVSNVNGLTDYNLLGTDGEDLGEVEDLLILFQFGGSTQTAGAQTTAGQDTAAQTGIANQASQGMAIEGAHIRYALVETGGFLGLGENSTLVPLSTLGIETDDAGVSAFRLPVTQEQLDEAPDFNPTSDGFFADNVNNQYTPYWDQYETAGATDQ